MKNNKKGYSIFPRLGNLSHFYTPPHDSGGVLWFQNGRPFVRPSACRTSVRPSVRISFPENNLSKYQWNFAKLGMCIDIMEIWFGIASGQISSIFDEVICPRDVVVSFPYNNLSNY